MAALEMTAVVPVLLLVVVACIDFGRALSQSIELTNAVKAGAQYAVTDSASEERISTVITDSLPENLSAATVQVVCRCGPLAAGSTALPPVTACSTACPANDVRVMTLRAQLPYSPISFAISGTMLQALNMDTVAGNVTIRHQ